MKSFSRELILVALLLGSAGCATEQQRNQTLNINRTNTNKSMNNTNAASNVETAAPQDTERLLGDQSIEVVRVNLPPNGELPPHDGTRRVIYSLNDYKIKFIQDGKEDERSFKSGDVHYHSSGVHSIKNVGTTNAEFVIFERLDGAFPARETVSGKSLLQAAAKNAKELLNNEYFEVTDVNLSAKESLPTHFGLNRAIYSISPYTIKYKEGDGEAQERSFKQGDVHFHPTGLHTVENVGATEAKFLVVEFKK
ncbi:MAG: hypothetical protein ABI686_00690 [Acidobacteriota bacterium]